MRWYVISCKDREMAISNLENMGFNTFMPVLTIRDSRGERSVSMFGMYIFVQFDIDVWGWQKIWNARGVRRILCMTEDKPSPVPEGFVEMLLEEDVIEDLVRAINEGDLLRIKDGPFAGHEGLCAKSSSKRVIVLLHLLGKETQVYLNPNQLEHVN